MAAKYPYKEIEAKWQEKWNDSGLYRANSDSKEKYYLLVMFAYPSGDIHMGHFRNYIVGDAVARKKMMEGKDVLHPFGWDAFGLPAENAAIKRGIPPQTWTEDNIKVSRETLQKVGISFDWSREVVTCRPDYYKWNQWLFLLLFKTGLAERKRAEVNWCPGCLTVLANEQVVAGLCDRCSSKVEKKALEQWFLKITEYAQRLLDDLDTLPGWPENVKAMQRNWIGRSEGLEADFKLEHNGHPLRIYTTRPDTIYGVTFMALAPESDYVNDLELEGEVKAKVEDYIEKARQKGDMERSAEGDKDGIFTGRYAINPFSGEKVPVWVADYVLAGYGTGAIMAVPAHDDRDFAFARKYDLPIQVVLKLKGEPQPSGLPEAAFTASDAEMINSSVFDGKVGQEGISATIKYAEEKKFGRGVVHFRLRDWLVSRQRYWGTPIPIIHCPKCGPVAVPDEDLPVTLPEGDIDFVPKGKSPLADVPEFMNVDCPECGEKAQRDSDTMDTFVDSSWYFLRYLSPSDDTQAFARASADRWIPVDKYIGGITHATGHLMYFRFITKVLYDNGLLSVSEPSRELFNHGMVMDGDGRVMSKRIGNVVSPIEVMEKQGVDVARLTMYYASPSDRELLWNETGAVGVARFLDRIWRVSEDVLGSKPDLAKRFTATDLDRAGFSLYGKLNRTIAKVDTDYEAMQFNTGMAALMELLNEMGQVKEISAALKAMLTARMAQLIAPLAPHFAEEIWARLGYEDSIFRSQWPSCDPEAMTEEVITMAVQVNGKLRGQLQVSPDIEEKDAIQKAYDDPQIAKFIDRDKVVKTIFIPRRLINIVAK